MQDQNLYLTNCLQGHVEESAQTENLLLHLMKAAKSLYLTLRSQDSVPSYIEADFNASFIFVSFRFIFKCWVSLEYINMPALPSDCEFRP